MDEEDTTVFSQRDLPRVCFAAFEDMRKRGHLCDVTIKLQNHSFPAHRVILEAAIPYFEKVFSSCAVETGDTEISEELHPLALESLIHFAYTNEVKISPQNAQSLLVASHFLRLNQVGDACVEFLSKKLRVKNVLEIRTFASSLNNVHLFESCNNFISKNFEQFMESNDFLSLDHSCIKKVLSDDDLNVSSEEVVYEALIKWVKASPDERQSTLSDLLCEVRMIYLPIHYIVSQVDTEELIVSSKACLALMNQVKSYHLLARKGSEFPNLKTRPRNQLNFYLYGIFVDVPCGYSLQYFDFAEKVWHVLASKKVKCEIIESAVVINDIIYMFLDTTIQTFHRKTLEWEELELKDESFYGSAIVSHKNRIYCLSSNHANSMQKVRCFDTQLNEWLKEGKINTGRYDLAAASLEDSIYVTGGQDGAKGLNIVEKYNILTGVCSDATPMLTPRYRHGCCAMNGRVYVCGGWWSSSTAEVHDPQTNQWEFISLVRNLTYCHSMISHLNKLYACGESEVQVYDAEENKWEMLVSHPGRGFRCAVWGPSVIPKQQSKLNNIQLMK